MKLRNSLYRITNTESTDSKMRYDIRLDVSHFIYQAHFPGEPVTPGVCIIQIAQELLEEKLQTSLSIQKVKNVKFLTVISPTATPDITYLFESIIPDETHQTVKSQVLISSGEASLAKISFTCKRNDE